MLGGGAEGLERRHGVGVALLSVGAAVYIHFCFILIKLDINIVLIRIRNCFIGGLASGHSCVNEQNASHGAPKAGWRLFQR